MCVRKAHRTGNLLGLWAAKLRPVHCQRDAARAQLPCAIAAPAKSSPHRTRTPRQLCHCLAGSVTLGDAPRWP